MAQYKWKWQSIDDIENELRIVPDQTAWLVHWINLGDMSKATIGLADILSAILPSLSLDQMLPPPPTQFDSHHHQHQHHHHHPAAIGMFHHVDNDDHDDGKYDDMAGYSEWATNDKVFLRYRDGLCTIFHLLWAGGWRRENMMRMATSIMSRMRNVDNEDYNYLFAESWAFRISFFSESVWDALYIDVWRKINDYMGETLQHRTSDKLQCTYCDDTDNTNAV